MRRLIVSYCLVVVSIALAVLCYIGWRQTASPAWTRTFHTLSWMDAGFNRQLDAIAARPNVLDEAAAAVRRIDCTTLQHWGLSLVELAIRRPDPRWIEVVSGIQQKCGEANRQLLISVVGSLAAKDSQCILIEIALDATVNETDRSAAAHRVLSQISAGELDFACKRALIQVESIASPMLRLQLLAISTAHGWTASDPLLEAISSDGAVVDEVTLSQAQYVLERAS